VNSFEDIASGFRFDQTDSDALIRSAAFAEVRRLRRQSNVRSIWPPASSSRASAFRSSIRSLRAATDAPSAFDRNRHAGRASGMTIGAKCIGKYSAATIVPAA
jgi:hypothetical protein